MAAGGLVPVVSGRDGAAAVRIGTASATLHAAVLDAGESVTLPDDPLQHVFVATGSLARSSLAEPLSAGDAFRISDRPGLSLTAASPTELLVWSFTLVEPGSWPTSRTGDSYSTRVSACP